MSRRRSNALAASLLAAALSACSQEGEPVSEGAAAGPGASSADHAVSPPLLLLPDVPARPRWARPRRTLARTGSASRATALAAPEPLGPVVAPALGTVPGPITAFEGIGALLRTAPPDTVGDAGLTHYVQMVNSAFAVYDKTTHAILQGPTNTNALFSGLGRTHLCSTTNQGDGLVLYDSLGDRWVLTQFAFDTDAGGNPIAPFFQCVAVSRTPDPTGQYDLYAFGPFTFGGADALNDYPKLGVWSDAYYMTANMFSVAGAFRGAKVCALDRARMLAGAAATMQCFEIPLDGGLLPADLDGRRPPPAGSPGYVLTFDNAGASVLQFWRVQIDWATPANSRLLPSAGTPMTIPVDAITQICGASGTCIPQPGTATRLDSLDDRLMHRLAYRNFGDHESLVVTHTVDPGLATTRSGLRWYELRNKLGATLASDIPVVEQSGTYSPDATYRWMGSAAQDEVGDIAIGYSASSTAVFPSLRYTGRLWNDPDGRMGPGEATLFAGTGSQVNPTTPAGSTAGERWGDYSALAVDPGDECTFWYTNEYLVTSGSFNWHTRIGSFRLPTCPPRYLLTLPPSATVGQAVNVTVTATDALGATLTSYAGSANVTTDDAGAAFSAGAGAFVNGVAKFTVTFASGGAHGVTVSDPFSPNLHATVATTVSSVAAVPTRLGVTGLTTATAGVSASYTVTALDAAGNPAPFTGTAAVSSSDPRATLTPATLTVSGAATGAVTFASAGTQTLAVTSVSPSLSGTATITVAPAAPASLAVGSSPATGAAGTAAPVSVVVRDTFGNGVPGVTVTFSAPTGASISPPNAVTDASGTATATATVGTAAGSYTFTASAATFNVSFTIGATPGAASRLAAVSGGGQTGPVVSALAANFVVKITDAFGNAVPGAAVSFSSTDGSISPPSTSTLADGTASATCTLGTAAGTQTFTATSTGLAGSPVSVSASAAPRDAATVALTGLPATVTAGTAVPLVVAARDAFGNLASGSCSLTTTDPAATVSLATVTLAGAAAVSTVTFRTQGPQAVTARLGALVATATATVTVEVSNPKAPAPSGSAGGSGGCTSSGGGADLLAAFGSLLALARTWRRRRP